MECRFSLQQLPSPMPRALRRLLKLTLLSVASCFCATAFALDNVTLQLKWTHSFQFAGYYAAQEQGYYRDAGLAVTIKEAQPADDPVNEVIAGNAEFGVGSSSLLLERKAGKPVVVLAVIIPALPLCADRTPDAKHSRSRRQTHHAVAAGKRTAGLS